MTEEQPTGRWIAPALFVLTFLLYLDVGEHDFVAYDDATYVARNEHVGGGLSASGIWWAIRSVEYACNWHPLTWISHMLDVSLFGTDAGGHHLHSVLLHALSAGLLFAALRAMTGAMWRSALVAALFAWHPLRVESVAWVAERKDVLSGVYWMATIWLYARWVKAPSSARYALVAVSLALGLSAKPMLVTLPFVLLLLDRSPLGRTESARRLVVEKLPLFALAIASVLVTLVAQANGGCTTFIEEGVETGSRVANAAVAYAQYLGKTFWPTDLAVFYPHPSVLDPDASRAGATAVSLALLALVSAGALLLRARVPAVLCGWLWFLGTLVPVLGVVQVGGQAMADRYAYLPLIGVYVAVVWGGGELAERRAALRVPLVGTALLALAGCVALTWRQIPVWTNTTTLFTQALGATDRNYVAHTALGNIDGEAGRLEAARVHYQTAASAAPRYYEATVNLGWTYVLGGDSEAALPYLESARDIRPDESDVYYKIGRARHSSQPIEARAAYEEATRLAPDSFEPRLALGFLLVRMNDMGAARTHLREAILIRPDSADARLQLALVLTDLGPLDEAEIELNEVRRLAPNHPGLAQAWQRLRERSERDN